ncbi:MAG: hypothetical protein WCO23_01605 [bacterium]
MKIIEYFDDSRVESADVFTALQFAAALALKSTHPLSSLIVEEVEKSQKVKVCDIAESFSETNIGMSALITKNSNEKTRFYLGSADYVTNALKIPMSDIDSRAKKYLKTKQTVLLLANQYRLLNYIIIGGSKDNTAI